MPRDPQLIGGQQARFTGKTCNEGRFSVTNQRLAAMTGGRFCMAHLRGFGGLATITAGETQFWQYSYGANGQDVGIAYAAPNLLDGNPHIELIALEQGVTEQLTAESIGMVYTVRIQASGLGDMSYNLNIEDWQ
jgi:hypothetical protein